MTFDGMYRGAMLAVADAAFARNLARRFGWRLGVGRFVAGETFDAAVPALRRLEASGRRVILDVLGEFVHDEPAARDAAARIGAALDGAHAHGVEPYVSVKPTQLGLGVDAELAYELADALARRAEALGGHLCLDMESSPYVDGTLALYRSLLAAGHGAVSTVLQSYLRRTPEDLRALLELSPAPTLRLVKGAYRERPEVAHQAKRDVDAAFRTLVYQALQGGARTNVATHDEALLREVGAFARGAGAAARYEMQLLYGVKPGLQERLVSEGHTVRVYVPFGEDWYGYFSRRLAERPANLAFVLRGLVG